MKWTKEMHQLLAIKILKKIFAFMAYDEAEDKDISEIEENFESKIPSDSLKIINNRVFRILDEYNNVLYDEFEQEYEHDYDDGFYRPEINFNYDFYKIWMDAVKRRRTVWMRYKSESSGMKDRLVDPYESSAPYGKGYCHTRKEVRKFRFDRVIDIKITDKDFIKPRDWKDRA